MFAASHLLFLWVSKVLCKSDRVHSFLGVLNLIIAIEKDKYESHLLFKILPESDIDSFIAGFIIIKFVCRHMDRTGTGRDMLCTDQEKGNTGIEV